MTLHISPNGSDYASGSQDNPFKTLQRAIDAARERGAKEIFVHSGIYENTAVILDSRDNGLKIRGEKGSVLCGGLRVSGWQKSKSDNQYKLSLPNNSPSDFRILVRNGHLVDRARYPESGELRHKSTFSSKWMSTTAGGWDIKPTHEQLTTLHYNPEDISPSFDWQNAELTVFHKWDETLVAVSDNDIAANTFKLRIPCGHPPGAFGSDRYIVWNTREGMGLGKWMLDKKKREIYYTPADETSNNINEPGNEFYIPCQENIISIQGSVNGLTIEDLSFMVTSTPMQACGFGASKMPGAIDANGMLENCKFRNLKFRGLSGWALKLSGRNIGVCIEGCDIEDAGAGGICVLNGEGGSVIRQNRVSRIGKIYFSAIGIYTSGCDIIGNYLSKMPYSGISSSGLDGVCIRNNRVDNVLNVLNDGGGIYVTFAKNGIIRDNCVTNIFQKQEKDSTRNGIYLDEQCENWLVEGNITFNCSSAMMNHMARNNTVRNNSFISCDEEVMLSFIRCEGYEFYHNTIQTGGAVVLAHRENAFSSFEDNRLYSSIGRYDRIIVDDEYRRCPPVNLFAGEEILV